MRAVACRGGVCFEASPAMVAELQPDIERMIREREFFALRRELAGWPPPDLARLISELETDEQVIVFRILPRKLATDVFEYLDLEVQEQLLKTMAQTDVARILNDMAPDDRTELLEELPAVITRQMLALLTPGERAVAVSLLGYPEGSIGRLMTPDYVRVKREWTVQHALDHIRRHGRDSETLSIIYVVDERGALIDDIRIREFLLAEPESLISELMDERFVALKATDDQEAAVSVFRDEDRSALPVTDSTGVLIGIVTFDDVLDVAEEEATEDFHKVASVGPRVAVLNEGGEATLYELEDGKYKRPGKDWLGFVGKRVEVAGRVRAKGDRRFVKVDALKTLADAPAATEQLPNVVGNEAELVLKDLFGVEQRLSALRGRVVVLNFWATYCAPCRKEMPDLAATQNQYAALGVQVVGASAETSEDRQKVLEFVRETRVNFPVWLGATVADMARFGLGPDLPGTAIVGRDGKIVWLTRGVVNEAELKRQLDTLLARDEREAREQRASAKVRARDASSVPS